MQKWVSDSKLDLSPYPKLNIIFINVFSVLQKAATLNLSRLFRDLREIRKALPSGGSVTVYMLRYLIPIFVLTKFIVGFFSMVTKIIAMLPILSEELPEMLLPTILSQLIENVFLPMFELILGLIAANYTYGPPLLTIFTLSLIFKVFGGVIILNVYMNYFTSIRTANSDFPTYEKRSRQIKKTEETLLKKENLFQL